MDGPRCCHMELSQSGREGEILHDIPYMWNLKEMIQMNLFTKQKQTRRLRECTYGLQRGRASWGVWDEHVHSAILKMDNQHGPTGWHRELCSMWQPG